MMFDIQIPIRGWTVEQYLYVYVYPSEQMYLPTTAQHLTKPTKLLFIDRLRHITHKVIIKRVVLPSVCDSTWVKICPPPGTFFTNMD